MNGETTCGLKNSYIEACLGEKEAGYFIPKWSKSEKRFGIAFNPFAFMFSFLWLFHINSEPAFFYDAVCIIYRY